MCNANNHPPGCNCGWGGVWYGGGGGGDFAQWLFNKPKPVRKIGLQVATLSELSGGITHPNAACPVCGAPVYYYESSYGGRVYFDELGPPWPKHPCTANEPVSSPRSPANKSSREDWKPFGGVTISEKAGAVGVYSATGTTLGKKISICFRSSQVVMADIFRYRPVSPGLFEVSILDYDSTKKNWLVWSGMAVVDPARLTDALSCSIIHSHPDPAIKKKIKAEPKKEMPKCPVCTSCVREDRLITHVEKVHKIIFICVDGVVSGRMAL